MSAPALRAEDLLKWNDDTSQRWRALMREHPEALEFECDIYNTGTVAEMLRHIHAAELRYAERLIGVTETPYDSISNRDAEAIYVVHDKAHSILRECLNNPAFPWQEEMEFNTLTLGRMRATRETIFLHLLLHAIRHYAQLATLVRQRGIQAAWPMDYLPIMASRVKE